MTIARAATRAVSVCGVDLRVGCMTCDPARPRAQRIESLQIHREEQSLLPAMLLSSDGGTAKEGRILEVSFAPEDREAKSSAAEDVLLVYLPPAGSGEQAQAIGVAGAFEAGSEWVNPYTLLVVRRSLRTRRSVI